MANHHKKKYHKAGPSVYRDGNRIIVSALDSPMNVKDFTTSIKGGIFKAGYQDLVVEVNKLGAFYPNVAVPICGIIEYYNRLGIADVTIEERGSYSSRPVIQFYSPTLDKDDLSRPLSKVWRFTSLQEQYEVQKALVNELRKEEIFANGVLEGIEWSVNEIMDNVLNHSGSNTGFIMGQLHKSTKHVAFTIFDAGIGIYNSFKNSSHYVRSNVDALSLCLQEGVTRDPRFGQGNGLAGLFSLIKEGNGLLYITSGMDAYSYQNGTAESHLNQSIPISKANGCTTVDFQIDYSVDVSIDKVLTFQGKPFEFTNLYLEELEDERGVLHFVVSEMSEGTGTRESASRLKNQMLNSMKASNSDVIIDFTGIEVVSSSFIDELLAKLLIELGLFQFNQRIKLANMSPLLQKTLQKSVIQRIIEDYSEVKPHEGS